VISTTPPSGGGSFSQELSSRAAYRRIPPKKHRNFALNRGFFLKKEAPREKEVKKPGGQTDDTVDEKQRCT
jgi:hypothetical protein